MDNSARSLEANAPQTYKRKRELIDGIPVMMSPGKPSHGRTAFKIATMLEMHPKKGKCVVFSENALVKLNDNNKFVPDVAVVCDPSIINDDEIDGAPILVVEVLSPTTASNDRTKKKRAYAQAGVKEFWLVDITSFSIEVYFLKDDNFELDEVYMLISKNEEKHLRAQEEFIPPNKFVSPIFGGVDIDLYKVFGEILPEGF